MVQESIFEKERIIRRFLKVFYRDKEEFDNRLKDIEILTNRLNIAIRGQLTNYFNTVFDKRMSLERFSPYNLINSNIERIKRFKLRLNGAILNFLNMKREFLENNITRLNLLDPEKYPQKRIFCCL
jgi:exonuclease VII large subunit